MTELRAISSRVFYADFMNLYFTGTNHDTNPPFRCKFQIYSLTHTYY